MKIRIIGYAGSGKTSLTIKLQEKYAIQGISLDDFLRIKDKKERAKALSLRLSTLDSWIVEGVQVGKWTQQTFLEADLIVLLDYPIYVTQFRILKRTVSHFFDSKRDFSQKTKAIKRMFKLFKWNQRFKKRLPQIKKNLYETSTPTMILESPKNENRLHQYIKRQIRLSKQKKKRL